MSFDGKSDHYCSGGIEAIEVTFTVDYAHEVIKALKQISIAVFMMTMLVNCTNNKNEKPIVYMTSDISPEGLVKVYEALGVAQAELDLSASDYIYSQSVAVDSLKTEDGTPTGEVVYSLSDDLVKPSTTDGWYGRYINYDEATATETPVAMK